MDALAAYGSDSDSDSETMPSVTKTTTTTGSTAAPTASKPSTGLSSMLPPPKTSATSSIKATPSLPAPSSTALPKGGKYSTMPTLDSDPDSDEEESPFRKKARLAAAAAKSGSGVGALFAMLPTPKNAPTKPSSSSSGAAPVKASFMPRTVAKKPAPVAKKATAVTLVDEQDEELAEDNDDDDDGDEAPVSFFPVGAAVTASTSSTSGPAKAASNTYIPLFFNKKPLTTAEKAAEDEKTVDVSMSNEQYAYPTNDQYAYPSNDQYAYPSNEQYSYPTNDQYSYDQYAYQAGNDAYGYNQSSAEGQSSSSAANGGRGSNTVQLDEAGLKQLGMRKARDEPIHVIDVYAKDQMSQAQHARQAMSGSNSQPQPVDLASISHLKPSTQQKRKHNIMSLAYEAKANAAQLNASWAASRQTKAETQSKYGF
ncbi:hypothetical protein BGZ83_003701 [Gryganskiella cystojenkinii]|nr:hypothetical protein BGZ83_003701 [Gryganskiella cystojenkinii]